MLLASTPLLLLCVSAAAHVLLLSWSISDQHKLYQHITHCTYTADRIHHSFFVTDVSVQHSTLTSSYLCFACSCASLWTTDCTVQLVPTKHLTAIPCVALVVIYLCCLLCCLQSLSCLRCPLCCLCIERAWHAGLRMYKIFQHMC